MASNFTSSDSHSTMPESVDERLLLLCREGDRMAQQSLYDMCQPLVSRVTAKIVGQQDAPDVTQNVFLQVFRKLNSFEGNARFETWLYRLTVNAALQHLRKLNRRKVESLVEEPMSRNPTDEQSHAQRELLDEALQRLSPDLRVIFILKEVESKPYEEISTIANIPAGTVGSRLTRARQELRRHLIDLGWEP